MVRAQPTGDVLGAPAPGIVGDSVDVGDVSEASPHRADAVVIDGAAQVELARERAGATGSVDQPARLDVGRAVRAAGAHAMCRAAAPDLDRVRRAPDPEVHAVRPIDLDQIALEACAVELEARDRGRSIGAHLAQRGQLAVARFGVEEEAQTVLRQVLVVDVRAETLLADQVVRGDFDR